MLDCTISFFDDGLWWKWLFTLKNGSKNDWKLIIGRVGIKMSWMEKNRKINHRWGGDDYSGLESIYLEKKDLHLFWWISIAISFKSGKIGWSLSGLDGIFSFIYNIKPSPKRLRSRRKIFYPRTRNWFIGNKLSTKWPTLTLLARSIVCCWISRRLSLGTEIVERFVLKVGEL